MLKKDHTQLSTGKKQETRRTNRKKGTDIWSIVIIISLILVCAILFLLAGNQIIKSAQTSYESEKEKQQEETYNQFYQSAYETAEKKHHVSNNVTISLGRMREEQNLEVLKVREEYFAITQKDGDGNTIIQIVKDKINGEPEAWLEVPGQGIFTVDLQKAEFIVDNERQYVLIRVPEPDVTEFTIDYENVKKLNFDAGGILSNSAKYGDELAEEQLKESSIELKQKINNNQSYYEAAQKSAQTLLETMVRELNPDLENLDVEVEFIK